MRKAFKWIFAILVIASVFCGVGCKPEVEVKPAEKKTGTIQGKAFYSNENVDNHSGIQITLVATDGLRSVAYCESRGIATNARSVSDIKTTAKDGSYSFENIPVGTYTIWASSRNSVEEAIETNVNVRANEVVTANDLNLVATGNIKGTITIDGKTDGTLGLDVFIAGTSYVAKVGPTGNYEISKIPASKGYMLCVQKGEYTTIINEDLEVKAKETIEVGCKNLLSEDWAIENEVQTNPTFKWLGEFATEPEDPDLYDAYYNTTDGCSYIWNGSDWDLLAKSGEDGADGEDGKDGVNGADGKDGVDGQSIVWKGELEAAPENPELYWAYYNTTDGCSYIWTGNDWDLLAKSGKDGADGEDGKDGTNGKDGEDGKDGVNGIDGKDGVDGLSIVWKGELEAAPENPELNWAYYNTTDGCSYIWNGSDWDLLAKSGEDGADGEDGKDGVNGADGKDGVDGQSIVWKGALEAAPENPELNWAYYNTEDGCSYIWNGSSWDFLAKSGEDGADGEDGKDGTNGKDGVDGEDGKDGIDGVDGKDGKDGVDGVNGTDGKDGVDGLSIVWKGELEAAPENPELYWAYYNTTDGCSYIWNGSNWDIIAQDGLDGKDGVDGKDGIDGIDGVDGLSIVWKGVYSVAPENPELNWAYFDTEDGCSYIWNGSDWDLLTQHANHTFNEWTVVTAPTCETEGKEERACTVCLYKEEKSIQIIDHSYGEYVSNNDATFDNDGTKTRTCEECGYEETVVDEGSKLHTHTYECKSDASGHWYECVCGTKKDFEEHTYDIWKVEQEPTASTAGRNERTCSYCGYVDSVVLQPAPEGFRFVKGGTITGAKNTNNWTGVFIEGRTVTLSDFYMGKYEVTQEEYASVMAGQTVTVGGTKYTLESNPNYCTKDSEEFTLFNGDVQEKRPVEGVTWYDAVWYCNALSEKDGLTKAYNIEVTQVYQRNGKTGYYIYSANVTLNTKANGYRLPTEAEWEYAARGGDPTAADWNYVFSGADTAEGVSYTSAKNSGLDSVGWYLCNSINGTTGDTLPSTGKQGYGTHQVGKKAPNRLGLYDMSGNVWEWCYDWSGPVDNETPVDGSASGSSRVNRGGSCLNGAFLASVSYRNPHYPYFFIEHLGFRVVRTAK